MHLRVRRGSKLIFHTARMFRFHMVPFYKLLQRIFNKLDEYDAKFTFPLVASVARHHTELTEWIKSYPYEIAIHGYKHVRYNYLSTKQQLSEVKKAIQIFEELKIPFRGFRAPYNNYTPGTLEILEKFHFKWDGGIGFGPNYRNGHTFFRITLKDGKNSSYICIPLCEYSDDRMIDSYKFSSKQISKFLKYHLDKAQSVKGLVMFDLHPIRIGQKKYVQSLSELLDYAQKINAWVPTVSEAVDYWLRNKHWKHNAPVCCILTGDIDNFTFFDYIRRF